MTDRRDAAHTEQETLLPGLRATVAESQAKARATRERKRAEVEPADVDPVARVLVDVPLAHLDRTFDYAVPAPMAEAAVPGARVKVRFAGTEHVGYVLARAARSDHPGRLAPLRRVVSPEPVLTPAVADLVGAVAERYAGSRSDVLRLAVPPRHATTEKEASAPEAPLRDVVLPGDAWAPYPHAAAYLEHLRDGGAPRAVWDAAPGDDWPTMLAVAAAATRASGRGVLLVVPDRKDVARVDAALAAVLGEGHHVVLTADAGPAARYRDFLALVRGTRRIAVGTRAAAFAPVPALGLVACWDDGDDLLAEPRAPYPHAREVLLLRAEREGTAALVGGFARSVEADTLTRTGWARPLSPPRDVVRSRARIGVAGASDVARSRDPYAASARVPREAYDAVRAGLERGPVLVQTPRAGYALSLACERCRTPADCATCHGPLAQTSPTSPPACRWCGTSAAGRRCPECGAAGLRAPVLGDARTGEELARAFPAVPVRTSSAAGRVLATVDDRPQVVVATPGAEPVAAAGYAAVVLLDAWLMLGRDDLRAEEEALRRWSNAVGLVAPDAAVVAVGDPTAPSLQALVRWDHAGFAARVADDRRDARLPPAVRLATITGSPGALDDARVLLGDHPALDVLGPVPVDPAPGAGDERQERLLVRVPRRDGGRLSHLLGELQRQRSSRKLDPVRVQVDPVDL